MARSVILNPFTGNFDFVDDVTVGSPANGLSIDSNFVLSLGLASTSTTGALSSTDWNTFNNKQPAGSYITALTGDATATGPGSVALTLATVNGNVGSFTNASITVNAKGLITAASNGTAPVTSLSVATANGFAGTSSGGSTPALTLSTTITGILQGNGTAISAATTTGSGAVVLATSPTLVTPALGTPSALVLTNATGLPVAGGGTGDASFTAYSVITGGTTSTGALQNVSGVGTSGQVLTSNGASALPTWQPASSSSIAPTIQKFLSTGTTTGYLFTVSSANATVGATYTNNGNTYTVVYTIAAGTNLVCSGSSTPTSSGTLTKSGGTGDATITFSNEQPLATYTTPTSPSPKYLELTVIAGGGGGSASISAASAGGGGAGSAMTQLIVTSPAASYFYSVGVGGIGGTGGGAGGSGNPSSFANNVCPAGAAANNANTNSEGGVGGSAGTINTGSGISVGGGSGSPGTNGGAGTFSGSGGNSMLGGAGGGAGFTNGTGGTGMANSGAGGGGGSPLTGAGGAGAAGIILVKEYY